MSDYLPMGEKEFAIFGYESYEDPIGYREKFEAAKAAKLKEECTAAQC